MKSWGLRLACAANLGWGWGWGGSGRCFLLGHWLVTCLPELLSLPAWPLLSVGWCCACCSLRLPLCFRPALLCAGVRDRGQALSSLCSIELHKHHWQRRPWRPGSAQPPYGTAALLPPFGMQYIGCPLLLFSSSCASFSTLPPFHYPTNITLPPSAACAQRCLFVCKYLSS